MSIVVGFIPTPEGMAAVAAAEEEAKRRKVKLIVVHSSKGGRSEDGAEVLEVRDDLRELGERLAEHGVEVVTRDVAVGQDPVDDLVGIAEEERADLIVIGLRRRSPVGKLIMGSNSQKILLEADCPVLAVKAD